MLDEFVNFALHEEVKTAQEWLFISIELDYIFLSNSIYAFEFFIIHLIRWRREVKRRRERRREWRELREIRSGEKIFGEKGR